jgi:hypothetical protein
MPAFFGITAILSFLGSSLVGLITWLVQRLSYRLVVLTSALVALSVLMTGIYSTFTGFLSDLALSVPPEMQSVAMFLPSNTGFCMSLIISAEIASLAYRVARHLIMFKTEAAK